MCKNGVKGVECRMSRKKIWVLLNDVWKCAVLWRKEKGRLCSDDMEVEKEKKYM